MKLSVMLPTYNRSHLIKNAIEKLLQQTYFNIEILVVDDCSTDNTEVIVKRIKDSRVKYIRNEKNYGAEFSELKSIDKCTGDYITFIADDDEYIDNNFFQESMEKVTLNQDIDIISGKCETVYNGQRVNNSIKLSGEYTNTEILKNYLKYMKFFNLGGNTIFKRTLFKETPFNSQHDYTTIFKLVYNAKKIFFIDKVVFLWFLSDKGDTFTTSYMKDPSRLLSRNIEFIVQVNSFLKEKNDLERFQDMLNEYLFESFENVKTNYYLIRNNFIFNKLLEKLDQQKDIYIYGKGMVGVELQLFLQIHNISINGFIDDAIKDDTYDLNIIDKNAIVIIASYKDTLIHKIYKNIISHNINYRNIIELI